MSKLYIPEGYKPSLNLKQTQVAIKQVKDFFQRELAEQFIREYNPFESVTTENPDRYLLSEVDAENRYSTKAIREVKMSDRENEYYAKRVALWVDERDLLSDVVSAEA